MNRMHPVIRIKKRRLDVKLRRVNEEGAFHSRWLGWGVRGREEGATMELSGEYAEPWRDS